jgi:hypothetical protein
MKFALACIIFLLSSCSSQVSVSDLVGNYTVSNGSGVDAIELKQDGTYVHDYTVKGGSPQRQQGSWDLETLQAGQTVALNDFHPLPGESTEGKGIYLLLVKRSFGRIHLITNIDLDAGYEKQR